jgi:ATP-binding cassette, subfamily C, bacterial
VLIPQEAYVFTGTIWDNVTYLRPGATTGEVERAVGAVGAEALLGRLGGLTAQLTPNALSAGERQLIALVRAYVAAAPLVVLDEATCYLDPQAERRAEAAFAERGGTLIVIAHRISSALRARRILVLDGTTALSGDHNTLLAASPLYRDLLGHWSHGTASAPPPAQPDPPAPCLRAGGSVRPVGTAHRLPDPR